MNKSLQKSKIEYDGLQCKAGKQQHAQKSVTGGHCTRLFDQFRQAAPHWPQRKRRDIALRSDRHAGRFAWKFLPAIELEAGLFQKFRRKSQVFCAINAPEPELFFIPLQEIQTFLQLFHGTVKRTSQKINTQVPRMPRIVYLDANAIFSALIAFDAAAIVIFYGTDCLGSCRHGSPMLCMWNLRDRLYTMFLSTFTGRQMKPEPLSISKNFIRLPRTGWAAVLKGTYIA